MEKPPGRAPKPPRGTCAARRRRGAACRRERAHGVGVAAAAVHAPGLRGGSLEPRLRDGVHAPILRVPQLNQARGRESLSALLGFPPPFCARMLQPIAALVTAQGRHILQDTVDHAQQVKGCTFATGHLLRQHVTGGCRRGGLQASDSR